MCADSSTREVLTGSRGEDKRALRVNTCIASKWHKPSGHGIDVLAVAIFLSCRVVPWVDAYSCKWGRLYMYKRDGVCQTLYATTIAVAIVISKISKITFTKDMYSCPGRTSCLVVPAGVLVSCKSSLGGFGWCCSKLYCSVSWGVGGRNDCCWCGGFLSAWLLQLVTLVFWGVVTNTLFLASISWVNGSGVCCCGLWVLVARLFSVLSALVSLRGLPHLVFFCCSLLVPRCPVWSASEHTSGFGVAGELQARAYWCCSVLLSFCVWFLCLLFLIVWWRSYWLWCPSEIIRFLCVGGLPIFLRRLCVHPGWDVDVPIVSMVPVVLDIQLLFLLGCVSWHGGIIGVFSVAVAVGWVRCVAVALSRFVCWGLGGVGADGLWPDVVFIYFLLGSGG